ncbi:MAG: hypothetical protein AMXMBFR58_22460 [Phycisphaerae bacterium]|nr:hypothetical protein [Phycisphaerales bacterium]
MQRLLQLYSRRIVNVNVNVIAAGILALGPTILVVHLSRHFGVADDDRFLITAITFFADVTSDVLIYFGLHWLANHRPGARRLSQVDEAYRQMSFVRDAATVQIQRIILSPLLYGVAFGTLYGLLHAGWARELASAVGLIAGIIATRILHTVWMLKLERAALEKLRLIKPHADPRLEDPAPGAPDGQSQPPVSPAGAEGASPAHLQPGAAEVQHNSVLRDTTEPRPADIGPQRIEAMPIRSRPAHRSS